MPQNMLPDAIVSNPGALTGTFTDIDDDPLAPNLADFMQSPASPVNALVEIGLQDATHPGTAVGWQALFVVGKDVIGGEQIDAVLAVYEGATVRQQWTDKVNISDVAETVIKDFTNAGQVVDITALRFRVTFNRP